jgi:hypothetical protein
MTPPAGSIALCYAVDQAMLDVPKHPAATRYPRAVVTLALVPALQGGGTRAVYCWLTRHALPWLPHVPARPRVARLFTPHTAWTPRFLVAPTGLGVAAPSGMALLHPRRAGRSPAHVGQQGLRHQRGRGGGTRCMVLNPWGVSGAWDGATAHVDDTPSHPLMAQGDQPMMSLTDTGVQAKTGAPATLQGWPRGTWHTRRLVATGLARRTTGGQSTHVGHRVWASGRARVAWTMAVCTLLVRWGLAMDDEPMVRLSIAEGSL